MAWRDWLRRRPAVDGETSVGEAAAGAAGCPRAAGPGDGGQGAGPGGRRDRGGRVLDIGWLVDGPSPAFLWAAPRPVSRARPAREAAGAEAAGAEGAKAAESGGGHPKAVDRCPAVLDGEARTWQVGAPVDLHLRIGRNDKGEATVVNAAGSRSSIAPGKLQQLVTLMPQSRWRDPRRPVLQVGAPYRFVCDEPCWLNQLPPYYHYRQPAWPGLLIGGRFPIHNWPRSLMWAFEWWDTARDLVIRRGDPWFYLRFETHDPARPLRLVEAEMTPELRSFCSGLDGITSFTNQTFQLMETAASRRPPRLLERRRRGEGAAASGEDPADDEPRDDGPPGPHGA